MTATDLMNACANWSGEKFNELVSASFEVLGTYQRDLAAEFEVAESTVSRWANGIARPHPRVQRQIITSIKKRAQRTMTAQSKAVAKSSSSISYPAPVPMAAKGR